MVKFGIGVRRLLKKTPLQTWALQISHNPKFRTYGFVPLPLFKWGNKRDSRWSEFLTIPDVDRYNLIVKFIMQSLDHLLRGRPTENPLKLMSFEALWKEVDRKDSSFWIAAWLNEGLETAQLFEWWIGQATSLTIAKIYTKSDNRENFLRTRYI